MPGRRAPRLVVVPSDPIAAYEKAGYDWLERYYNPEGIFGEVFAVSPLERGERRAHGMTIIGAAEREFVRVVSELHPDVLRAYGSHWPADFVCRHRVPGVPVLVSVHDVLPVDVHRSLRYADLVICMSRSSARQAAAVGVDESRIRLLPNRVDTDVFHPIVDPAALELLDERFSSGRHILFVGRADRQKNLDTLIRALQLLPNEYSCVFVGRGDTAPYKSLAEELSVSHRCIWIDAVQNSELPVWYSWCDCMCVPSRWEGFGIVFIEAAACGAAIVTSDIAPMNEYLVHNESACLVEEYENPGTLAEAVHKVCADSEYRAAISDGARRVGQKFDRRLVDAAEVAIYREAMNIEPRAYSLWTKADVIVSDAAVKVSRAVRANAAKAARSLPKGLSEPIMRTARRWKSRREERLRDI